MRNKDTTNTAQPRRMLPWLKIAYISIFFLSALYGIFTLARYITANEHAQVVVQEFGYWGVLIISYIAGLNAFVPVPAGAFVPIFVAADLWMPLIIATLVLGTTLADLTAYFAGLWGRTVATHHYPKILSYTESLRKRSTFYIIGGVFLYSALSPLPNELILIPLALLGVRLRRVLVPLILGTIIYQTVFALSAQGVVEYFL